jgi:hypothetical protein
MKKIFFSESGVIFVIFGMWPFLMALGVCKSLIALIGKSFKWCDSDFPF